MRGFAIAQPQSLRQVSSLLATTEEETCLMAGGTDLLDEMKSEIVSPDIVVDLKSIPELAYISQQKDEVRIGAMTTVADLASHPLIQTEFPGLAEAALSLATPQLRNVGTVGGNLCQRPRCWYYRDSQVLCSKKGGSRCFASRGKNKYHAIFGGGICNIVHPSDLAPVLLSLDAEINLSTPKGERTFPLADFYTLPRDNVRKENILRKGEILKEIKLFLPAKGAKSTYLKLKERGTWDFAVVSVAVNAAFSGKTVQNIKIFAGGVAPIPWRLEKTEIFMRGKTATEDILREAVKEDLKDARPLSENAYKKQLLEVTVYKAVLSLV
jgi:xanthine dehydrogenase YagS FAD-binding subunit